MKKQFKAAATLAIAALWSLTSVAVEPVWEFSVQVSANVQASPPKVILNWPQDSLGTPSSYTVYRKAAEDTAWGNGITLTGASTNFTDATILAGKAYEYQVVKSASSYTGYGYIYAGVNVPLVESRGKVILIVDNTYANQLTVELTRLQQDLLGDGWTVIRHDVARDDTPNSVKNLIREDYTNDPANTKAVFLFGHVPVAYSGNVVPDGHSPEHFGAWPADVFYGDMDGVWTDNTVNNSGASDARNRNVPGDGKFDQSTPPAVVKLQVGRVDLANMPGRKIWGGPATFPSELELLRQYLNKDHNFRHNLTAAQRRGIVGDYFGTSNGEAFAANGYRNFAPFFSAANTANLNLAFNDLKGVWLPTLSANDYLWAYGCGPGTYSSISGLGDSGLYNEMYSTDLVDANIRSVFTMLFGSWLGDWDSEDNLLRSVLATKDFGLTSCWSGRPHWFFQHMGLGETIGYSTRLTQNNTGLYKNQMNNGAGGIHVALMGDPTLRMHPVSPVSNVSGTSLVTGVSLAWTASPDNIIGYHVYRSATLTGPFTRLNSSLVTTASFLDTAPLNGTNTYMVRAVKLENTPSGTYYNASQGQFWTITGVVVPVIDTPTVPPANGSTTVWVDDAAPGGASLSADGGDAWKWVNTGPAPFAGNVAHQSGIATGLHQHYFVSATTTLSVNAGDKLFTYVYLDPANPPSELMLQWTDGSWEHRAYWGANLITYGASGTASRYYAGALPVTGQWIRLEVPASAVGLEGKKLNGMAFTTYNGRATWDYAGKFSGDFAPEIPVLPEVSATVVDGIATIGTNDNGVFTFSRTGATSNSLVINFTLGGSAVKWVDYRRPEGDMPVTITIPAGAASANLTIMAVANVTAANPATMTLTLATNAFYTVATTNVLTLNLVSVTAVPPSTNVVVTNLTAASVSVVNYVDMTLPKVGDSGLNILSPTLLELHAIGTKPMNGTPTIWNFVNSGTFTAPALGEFVVTVDGQPVAVQSVGFKRRPLYAPLSPRDLRIDNSLYLQLATAVGSNQVVEVKNPSGLLWSSTMQFTAKAEPLRYSPAIHVNQEGYVPALPKKAMVGYYLGSLGEMNIASSLGFSLVNIHSGVSVYQGTLKVRADVGYSYSPTPYQKVLEADFTSFTTPGEYQLMVPGLGASLPFMIDEGVAMGFTRAYALGLYHQRCGTNNVMPFTRHTHENCHHALVSVPMPSSSFQFTWTTISNYAMKANVDNPAQTAPLLTSPAAQLYPFVKTGALDLSGGHHDAGDYSKYTINSANLIHYLMFAVDSIPGVAALDNLGVPESSDGISDLMQAAKWEADYVAKLQDTDGGFYFLVYPREREYESGTQPDHGDAQVVWPKTTASTAAAVAALAQTASSPRFKQAYPVAAAAYLQQARLGWQFLTTAIARYGKDGAYQKITHYGDDYRHDDELAWAAAEMFAATGESQYQQKLAEWFPDPSNAATFRWGWWRLYGSYGHAIRSYAFAARSGRLTSGQLNAAYLAKCEAQIIAGGNDALLWSNQGAYGSSFPDATKRVRGAGWYFSNEQAFDIAVAQQITPRAEYLDAILANLNYEAGNNPVNVSYLTGMGWKRQREIVHQYAQSDRRVMPPAGIPIGNIQGGFNYSENYGSELTALTFPSDDAGTAPYPFYDRWADNFNVTTEFVAVAQARGIASIAYLATLTATKTQPWKSTTARIIGVPTEIGTNGLITATMQVDGLDLNGARIAWEARDQEPAYGSTFTFHPVSYGDQWVEAEAQWPDGRRAVAAISFFATNSLPTVSVVATDPGATEGEDTAYYTFTRTGNTSSALTVNYKFSGTAGKWSDFRRAQGDMPESIIIPAGAQTVTLTIYAVDDAEEEVTETAILTIQADATYNLGSENTATVYLYDNDNAIALPSVSVIATDPTASQAGADPGVFTLTRTGSTIAALTVNVTYGGTAVNGTDYGLLPATVTIPVGSASATVTLIPAAVAGITGIRTATMSLMVEAAYTVGTSGNADIAITGNAVSSTTVRPEGSAQRIAWSSVAGKTYRVLGKSNLTDADWVQLSDDIQATGTTTSWLDNDASYFAQRFYLVYMTI